MSPFIMIAAPSPAIFSAKTGSGTSDNGIISPSATATKQFFGVTSSAVSFDFDLNKFLKKLPIFIILSINISFIIHSIGKIKGISLTEYVKLIPNQ